MPYNTHSDNGLELNYSNAKWTRSH